jgi:hypothetical protein
MLTTIQMHARKTRDLNHERSLVNNHRTTTRTKQSAAQAAPEQESVGNPRVANPPFNPEEPQSYVQEDEAIFLHQVEIPLQIEEDEAQETRRRTRRQSSQVQQKRAQQGQKREIAQENKRHNHYFSQFTNFLNSRQTC